MRYTDELDAVRSREQLLRRAIAETIAAEAGRPADASAEVFAHAAEEAIVAWREGDEDERDMRAFRPLTPLQEQLAEHRQLEDLIADLLDRRLS